MHERQSRAQSAPLCPPGAGEGTLVPGLQAAPSSLKKAEGCAPAESRPTEALQGNRLEKRRRALGVLEMPGCGRCCSLGAAILGV